MGSRSSKLVISRATQRNLINTGITRAKRLLVVVGEKKALGPRFETTNAEAAFGAAM